MRTTWMMLVLAGALGACSKSAPAPGKVTAVDAVCGVADQTRVRVTGYLRYERGLLSFCSNFGGHKTCDLALYANAERPADFDVMHPQKGPEPVFVKISVPVGDQPGEMKELPDKFKSSDVLVNLPNKATAGEGTRITIDGTAKIVPGDPKAPHPIPTSCYVDVEWATAS